LTAPDIARELAAALEAIQDERETHQAMLLRLEALAKTAVRLHELGDTAACHVTCREALDLAHLALGDCEAFDPLVTLLGYSDPEPDSESSEGGVLS
jgi:hypothetical protein